MTLEETQKLLKNWYTDLVQAEEHFPGSVTLWDLGAWKIKIDLLLQAQALVTEDKVRKELFKKLESNLFTAKACFTGRPSREYMKGFKDREEVIKFTLSALKKSLFNIQPE